MSKRSSAMIGPCSPSSMSSERSSPRELLLRLRLHLVAVCQQLVWPSPCACSALMQCCCSGTFYCLKTHLHCWPEIANNPMINAACMQNFAWAHCGIWAETDHCTATCDRTNYLNPFVSMLTLLAELKPLADKIAQERKLLNTKAEEIFPILRQQWQQHFVAFMDNR